MIEIVSATRLSEEEFWSKSALGISLRRHAADPRLVARIAFENVRGLSVVFNESIEAQNDAKILVFIHDDVWIDDDSFAEKVIDGLNSFDIIGIAGNRRRVAYQPSWVFIDEKLTRDDKIYLSGSVAHGKFPFGPVSRYGDSPAECELMDGVFFAAQKSTLKAKGVQFDPLFDFHFYDLDFCRSARVQGLHLGTWPISFTHQSAGAFGSQHWRDNFRIYIDKWEDAAKQKTTSETTSKPDEIALSAFHVNIFQRLKKSFSDAQIPEQAHAVATPSCLSIPKSDLPGEHNNYKKLGNEYLVKGDLAKAAECYGHMLAIDSKNAEGFLNLGFALCEQQLWGAAEHYLNLAILINPIMEDAYYLLGKIAHEQNNLADAIENYNKALELKPDFETVYRDLCQCLLQAGQPGAARHLIEQGVSVFPNSVDFHYFLGNSAVSEKEPAKAIPHFLKILSVQPGNAEVHFLLGDACLKQGGLNEAISHFRKALALQPNSAIVNNNLGLAYKEMGNLDEAATCLYKALAINPNYAIAHSNLGIVLHAQGKPDAATECYRKAISINPDYAEAHNNLASALRAQGNFDDAIEHFKKAVSIKPLYAEAHTNLGLALSEQGRQEESIECFRHALSLYPDDAAVYSHLLYVLNFIPACSPARYLEEARHFGGKVMTQARQYMHWAVSSACCAAQPLRVGLVSGDFKNHPVGFFLESILALLDPSRIELVAYPTQPQEDDLTARIKPRFAAWRPITGLSNEAAAREIHEDGIHILIDLAGHTALNRLPVFAWKPAPVQVSWLGYWASTGVPTMDYLLADPISVPESHRAHFTETVWYLPDTRLCFTPPADANGKLAVTPLPALRNGYVTFGSFQSLAKVNDEVLALWGRIFSALPQARLRLQNKQMVSPATRERFQQRLSDAGIAPERVTLKGHVPRKEYLAAHAEVDIILDTFPFPGGTTTCEALWMGVPTLTLAEDTLLGRQGASMLTCAGLADWVAVNAEDYIARTLDHATNIDQLAQLRAGLRQQVLASPLFDARRFARNLEDALQGMWLHFYQNNPSGDHVRLAQ